MYSVLFDFNAGAKSVALAAVAAALAGATLGSAIAWAEGDGAARSQWEAKASSSKAAPPKRGKVEHEAKTATLQAEPASADKGEPAGQLQPQIHASNAGITACFDSLARASSRVIDGPHRAFSFWDPAKPNTGTFRSVIALNYGGAVSPRGAALIINSPMRDASCDTTTVQVVPTTRPCAAIQSNLISKGKAVANLTGLALIQTEGDASYLLLPTAGDGCTIVSMAVVRGK